MIRKIFGEILIRTLTSLLQISHIYNSKFQNYCKIILNFKIIAIGIKIPDDNFWRDAYTFMDLGFATLYKEKSMVHVCVYMCVYV